MSYQHDEIDRCLGLVTQFNPLTVGRGALIKADNAICQRENVVEDRRGYASYFSTANAISQLLVYKNTVLAHNGGNMTYDSSGSPANYAGSYSAPSGQKIRSVEADSNLYFTTSKGVQVLTDTAGTTARFAGSPRALDPTATLNAAMSGFLAAGSQCAYRAVIVRVDANSNQIQGYPSTRVWVSNPLIATTGNTTSASNQLTSLASTTGIAAGQTITGSGIPAGTTVLSIVGTTVTMSANATVTASSVSVTFGASKNVDQKLYFSSEISTSDIFQFYRTAQITGTATDGAGDEMQLVYQYSPTSTDLTNGFITFTDVLTDDLRGASLYTSPSQEGILQASDRPPVAKDICLYKNDFMIFANTSTKQRLFLTLIGVTGLTGKTLVLGGVTYNFGAENVATGTVGVTTSSITAVNIDLTARSLVRVINQYASNTGVNAYYLSGPGDVPGQILIEERVIGGAAFTVQASDATISGMFFPPPPVGTTNAKSTSSNSVQQNAVYFSKAKQHECVPALNYRLVGSTSKPILRVAPLRNSLVVIKEEGVFLLTGDDPSSFTVQPLDLTVFCKSADSVAVLSNQVFLLSNQGVVSVSETGVQVISREIENKLKPLLGFSNIGTLASGASYESERTYFLSLPNNSSDTAQQQIYLYNIFTKTWARWSFGFNAAVVEPGTDKLFFSKPTVQTLYRERKDFTDSDYSDPEFAITITAVNTTTKKITFTSSSALPQMGWVIGQGSAGNVAISTVVPVSGGYEAVMDGEITAFAPGAATLYPSVGFAITWSPWVGPQGAASLLKQVAEAYILTDSIPGNNSATSLTPTFSSNFDENEESIPINLPGSGWGGAWGAIPWGGAGDPYGYRTFVPATKQRCTRLVLGVQHNRAMERIAIVGCGFAFNMLGERIAR